MTNNLTSVWFESKYRIAQYGQFDGYPSGQGLTVLHFLRNIVNEDNFGLLNGQWDISNLPSDKEFLNTLEYIEEENV